MKRAPAVSTFSIVARDPDTGDLGVATASKFLAVGAVVPYAAAGVGAVATQSYANVTYGPRCIAALRAGIPLEHVHQAFAATDDEHAKRQYGLVDADGGSITFTGRACHPWAGGVAKEGLAAQGNLLTGPEVVEALVRAYEEDPERAFPERLLAGLAAADAAGGDKRGRQAAALRVVRAEGGYGGLDDNYIDLRVDDHDDPVGRLGDLLALHRLYLEVPDPADRLPIEGEVADRLTAVLVASGRLADEGPWTDASEEALRALAGVENLEMRMGEPGTIDRRALEHLEQRVLGSGTGASS